VQTFVRFHKNYIQAGAIKNIYRSHNESEVFIVMAKCLSLRTNRRMRWAEGAILFVLILAKRREVD
jgi:hypothetical protein